MSMRLQNIGLVLAFSGLCGCASMNDFVHRVTGQETAQPVAPDEFMQRQSAADRSETLNGDTQMPVSPAPARTQAPASVSQIGPTEVPAAEGPLTRPATQPGVFAGGAATEPTIASGQYLPMGGIVADVNGTPIYINKVLQLVWPTLRNDAKTMDRDQFYHAAVDVIGRQIQNLEINELLYAAAVRNLDVNDRKLAADLTTAYLEHLQTLAGGSIQEARRRAKADGDDFDEMIENRHRDFMIELYKVRKLSPRVEPSADDMRVYYRQNVDAQFTEHSEVVFDVLKIDPTQLGGANPAANRQLAFDRAKQAHDRAAAGETFATLFAEYNNDAGLKSFTNGTGMTQPMQRGTFAVKDVEDAVWKLQPGQVTDVLEIEGSLYLARMESRKQGQVRPFEDETVQKTIHDKIYGDRMVLLSKSEQDKLLAESIRTDYEDMYEAALNIAMQNFSAWNAGK